jgi:hypothetical protein
MPYLGKDIWGFIAGSILALVYKTKEYTKVIKYEWEHPDLIPHKTVLCSVLTKTVISSITS